MPHCIIEYSSNVADWPDWTETMRAVHTALDATGEFTLADVKTRVVRHETFFVGDGTPERSFVTATIQMLSGRDDAVKAAIADAVLEVLVAAFPRTLTETTASLTVQLVDIHRASYRRRLSGGG
jgi:5-carboxymethyl-2-hydroxymuconate isomerase